MKTKSFEESAKIVNEILASAKIQKGCYLSAKQLEVDYGLEMNEEVSELKALASDLIETHIETYLDAITDARKFILPEHIDSMKKLINAN
jgi:hypothetical protein